jgi:hypothetical protein
MQREVVTIALLAVASVCIAGDAAVPASGPALTVEQPRIDLGEIKAGTDAVATFIFHNAGPIDVRITRAKPS